ncbi:hypothetical protein ACN28E_38185 [Archangium lansingense]|uniref:hypothetical protein n=1 Tax=Archangium lansingense TaxID=2995310 RepID=UPI003B76A716
MKGVSKAAQHRSLEAARAFDQLIVATRDDSFEVLEARYKALERQLLRSLVKTDFERKELRRRIAERLFTEAFGHDCPWPVFGRTLRRIHRLGYSNVERRYHVACLYAMWCERHPEHAPREARRLLDNTEWHLLRLPRSSQLRQGLLEALSKKRRETGL